MTSTPAPGSRFGGFTVVEALGRGGMGAVYKVRDPAGRFFALKVIGSAPQDERLARRFQREARAAALVTHENVVGIHQVGEEAGVPFLVLELATGGTVKGLVKSRGRLAWRHAAALGAQVARGLGAIHAAGLVHRDMKPENVLLDAEGRAKVADFGLARGDAASGLSRGLTKTGELLGTLEYMAPEQMEDSGKVDLRADLYALGATLHFMLSGEPPFRGTGFELLTKHLREAPPRLRDLVPDVPPPLESLVLRLLSKDPDSRPQRADLVASELETIVSGRSGGGSRTKAWLVAPAVLLVAAAGVAVWIAVQPGATPPAPPPSPSPAVAKPRATEAQAAKFPRQCERFLSTKTTRLVSVWGEYSRKLLGNVYGGLAVSPDGKRVLTGTSRGITVWDAPTWEEVRCIPVKLPAFAKPEKPDDWVLSELEALAVSPDGKRAAAGTGEGAILRVDLETGDVRATRAHSGTVGSLAFLDERRVLSAGADGRLRITDLDEPSSHEAFVTPGREDDAVALARGRRRALIGCKDGTVRLVNLDTGEEVWATREHAAVVERVAVAPDELVGSSASDDRTVLVWDLAAGKVVGRLEGNGARIFGLAISSDHRVLSAGEDWSVRLFEPRSWTGQLLENWRASPYLSAAFTKDGKQALAVGEGGRFQLWDLGAFPTERKVAGHASAINCIRVSADGSRVLTASGDGTARVWDVATGKQLAALDPDTSFGVNDAALSPDKTRVLTAGYGYEGRSPPGRATRPPVVLWDLRAQREIARFGVDGSYTDSLTFSEDGSRAIFSLRTSRDASVVEYWELETRNRAWRSDPLPIPALLSATPDGHVVADAVDGTSIRFDLATGKRQSAPAVAPGSSCVARRFGDPELALYGGPDPVIVQPPDRTIALRGHDGKVITGAFSRDGKLAVTSGKDGTLRLWEATTGRLLETIDISSSTDLCTSLVFEPGGRSFFAGTSRGVILRFELAR